MKKTKSEKLLKKKAYCGDGILKYCVGKIFLIEPSCQKMGLGNNEYTSRLVSNMILSKIVIRNSLIFGEHKLYDNAIHRLGTIYEARLFDIYEKYGMDKCIEFVLETYEIKTRNSREIYENWMRQAL